MFEKITHQLTYIGVDMLHIYLFSGEVGGKFVEHVIASAV
jgi:hypothetical protein